MTGEDLLVRFASSVTGESIEDRSAAEQTLRAAPAAEYEAALARLIGVIDATDGDRQVAALETLYAVVDSGAPELPVEPTPLYEVADGSGRPAMLAAVVLRRISTGRGSADEMLTHDTAAVRRREAMHVGYDGLTGWEHAGALLDGLTDPDPDVRAGVARAIFKFVWWRVQKRRLSDAEEDLDEAALFDRLCEAAEDDDPRVRAWATVTVPMLADHHDVGSMDRAMAVLADGIVDDATPVEDLIEWYLRTYLWSVEGENSTLATLTGAVIRNLDLADQTEGFRTHTAIFEESVLTRALENLEDDGWEPTNADPVRLAAIVSAAGDGFDAASWFGDALLEHLPANPEVVTDALIDVAADDPTYLGAAVERLVELSAEGDDRATAALSEVAASRLASLTERWDRVREGLAFDDERAEASAEIVAAVAEATPEVVGDEADRAATVLYHALSTVSAQRREECVERLDALARAEPAAERPGIVPFVEDDVDEDRPVLAVVAEHDPQAGRRALASILQSVDPLATGYHDLRTLTTVLESVPATAAACPAELVALLSREWQTPGTRQEFASALGTVAEAEPSAFEPYVADLALGLPDGDLEFVTGVARALRAVGKESPAVLPEPLTPLAEGERGEDWPIDALAESAPTVVDRIAHDAVVADYEWPMDIARTVTTVGKYRPEAAESAAETLIERVDSRGASTSLWDDVASIAEADPELVAVGLREIVANAIAAKDEQAGRRVWEAMPALAERYPRQVWDLLGTHDPESEPSSLPERVNYRVEDDLEAVLEAAGPEVRQPGDTESAPDIDPTPRSDWPRFDGGDE